MRRILVRYLDWVRVANVRLSRAQKRALHRAAEDITRQSVTERSVQRPRAGNH